MTAFKERAFLTIAKHLYPEGYKFQREEAIVFRMGVALGDLMGCKDLTKVDFSKYTRASLPSIHKELGIDRKSLLVCYEMEKELFPEENSSKRLLGGV